MKKVILSFLLLLFSLLSLTAEEKLVISPPLIELLQATGIDHDGSSASILAETQKKWLRPAGKERWQISDVDPEKRERIIQLAGKLGFLEEKRPEGTNYEYGVVLGGTVGRMQDRFDYLLQLWNEGIRFKQIVFLTGERPLDPAVEPVTEDCKNESQAAHRIWEKSTIPKELRQLQVAFIDVPMFNTESGPKRPTTKDTYIAWLASNPKPGRTLLVSSQPYCLYQHALARSFLPESFHVETVGKGAAKDEQLGVILLDSIAQWIYYSSRKN